MSESGRAWIYHHLSVVDNKKPHVPFPHPADHYHNSVLISAASTTQHLRSKNDPKLWLCLLLLPDREMWKVWGWRRCWNIPGIVIPLLVWKGKPLMRLWSCVLMRLVTQRSVPARLEVASQSGSQAAKTLLLFSVCSARLYHSQSVLHFVAVHPQFQLFIDQQHLANRDGMHISCR